MADACWLVDTNALDKSRGDGTVVAWQSRENRTIGRWHGVDLNKTAVRPTLVRELNIDVSTTSSTTSVNAVG